jgi:hypothetical protein
MHRLPRLETLLLLLIATALFLGGGLGCEPELEGTDLRVAAYEQTRYVAFYGKKPPGNGWAVLEYPIVPTASIEANVGVVNPRYFDASEDAEGCIGLRQSDALAFFQICVTYLLGPTLIHISSNLSGATAQCPTVTGARLRLVDDGVNLSAFYTCPGGMETLLDDVESEWDAGEKWFAFFGGYNLGKGAEVGFSELRYASDGPFDGSADAAIAYATFETFRLGIDAFHLLDEDFGGGAALCSDAFGELNFATFQTLNLGAFPDTDVQKDLIKSHKSYAKLGDKLFPDKFGGYFKGWPKIADTLACAMSEQEDFLD